MSLMIICKYPARLKSSCLVLMCCVRRAIHDSAKTLNRLGQAMGEEIQSQNKHLGRVIDKTDRVDDQIAVNRARLDRIK